MDSQNTPPGRAPTALKRGLALAGCAAVLFLGVWGYLYLQPSTWDFYGDGFSVRRLAREVEPDYLLWEKADQLPGGPGAAEEAQCAAVSPDGLKMVYSKRGSEGDANLYLCRWDGFSWGASEPLRALNSRFNESSPAFSQDGAHLFFSTDRPGGLGGFDIWAATWDGTDFAWPLPLGPLVNSRFDDIAPRSSSGDAKLYFSSNRPRTLLMKEDDHLSYKDLRQRFVGSDYDIYTADRFPGGYTNTAVERAMSILYSLRTSALSDPAVMAKLGGSGASEAAVDRALAWLAKTQTTNGCWLLKEGGGGHEVAATSAALMAFFGRGVRHDKPGNYQKTVADGLKWLVARQNRLTGDFRGKGAMGNAMYDQAFATLAVVEAYGLSKDQDLFDAAQSAIYFIADAQNENDGGWRYVPREPGDLSVSGWVIMALKSAQLSGIVVPPKTLKGARKFLESVSFDTKGGGYAYKPDGSDRTPAMQAAGFFCSQLMGLSPNSLKAFEMAGYLRSAGVTLDNIYYTYYGTVAANQNQGPLWKDWLSQLQEGFLAAQSADGSWISKGHHGDAMGPVIATSLVTLSLQAHYRYVPLYGLGCQPGQNSMPVSAPGADDLPPLPEFDRARPLAAINSPADDLYAEPTRHGDFIYFASNRAGGEGGFDLYRAHVEVNQVEPPQNLGPAVNTSANETAPASCMAGFRLVFSSDRDLTNGQYRLYSADTRIVFRRYDYSKIPSLAWLWDHHGQALLVLGIGLTCLAGLVARIRRQRRGSDEGKGT